MSKVLRERELERELPALLTKYYSDKRYLKLYYPDSQPDGAWIFRVGTVRYRFNAGRSERSTLEDLKYRLRWGDSPL